MVSRPTTIVQRSSPCGIILECFADPSGKGSLEPTSSRSVEACLRLGIEPSELHFMPLDIFLARFRERDLADIAYTHHETVRQVGIHPKRPAEVK